MSSSQGIVSSRMVVGREGAIRSRISRGQRQLAGAMSITVSYALVTPGGEQDSLRAPSPQIVHEGRMGGIQKFEGYGASQTSPTFVIQSCMATGDL